MVEKCGSNSETSVPCSPYLRNFHGEPNTRELAWAALSYLILPGNFSMCSLFSRGFGVQQIDLTGPALHEHRNHRGGTRLERRPFGR